MPRCCNYLSCNLLFIFLKVDTCAPAQVAISTFPVLQGKLSFKRRCYVYLVFGNVWYTPWHEHIMETFWDADASPRMPRGVWKEFVSKHMYLQRWFRNMSGNNIPKPCFLLKYPPVKALIAFTASSVVGKCGCTEVSCYFSRDSSYNVIYLQGTVLKLNISSAFVW